MIDQSIISYVVRNDAAREVMRAGIELDDFVDEYRTVWRYISKQRKQHGATPSKSVVLTRFPDLDLPKVRASDVPMLLHDLKMRRKYMEMLAAIEQTVNEAQSFEVVDEAVQSLQAKLLTLGRRGGSTSHLVDLFSADATKEMLKELKKRRLGSKAAIKTSLGRFDDMAGGLYQQEMAVVMGRTGIGKSWIDLLFVAHAVMQGKKVLLLPLEMTLAETAFRLYTIFTQVMYGGTNVLKNYELTTGNVTSKRVRRFLTRLEDKFAGHLFVADTSKLTDRYTVEKIAAEVEREKYDMFWVDYLTLLKAPSGSKERKGFEAVGELSRGIMLIAQMNNCVGGCSAQVNREGVNTNALLPRLEHIAYGDSIGQDAHKVFSINRKGDYLYYALVKNRSGPEIGRTKVKFDVDQGIIQETPNQEED